MANYWELEDGTGRWQLEDGSGSWLLESQPLITAIGRGVTAFLNKRGMIARILNRGTSSILHKRGVNAKSE